VILRVLIVALLLLGVFWFLRWFRSTPPARVARVLRKVGLWTLIGVLVLAVVTGRLNPIFAAFAALVPTTMRLLHLVQMLPALQRLLRALGVGLPGAGGTFGGGAATAGTGGGAAGISSIRTRFLVMNLDHASGAMDGEVLEGPFVGRRLKDLGLDELLRMLELYREADAQSAAVLEAYLDRERGAEWRDRDPGPGVGVSGGSPGGGPMNEAEALAILGIDAAADATAIRDAHRRLMQKLHPDRGGSDYLAAKINEAKQVLLKKVTSQK
jgi:hypothetical protein